MTTLEQLEKRVIALEQEMARLRQPVTATTGQDTPAARARRRLREMSLDQAALSAGMATAFAEMGIVGEALAAEKVQQLVAACGFKPEDNVFSRGIIDMREE